MGPLGGTPVPQESMRAPSVNDDFSALQPAGHLSPQRAALFRGATSDALLVFDDAALGERLRKEIGGGGRAALAP